MAGPVRLLQVHDVFGQHAAVEHVHDACRMFGMTLVVRDHDNRRAVLVELSQQLEHFLAVDRVEVARRLVREDQFRLRDDRAGHGNTLLLTAAELLRAVIGAVRVKLHKGHATVVGRKSEYALYQHALATYDEGDVFDQSASPGFIHLWGLPIRTQARVRREA